MKVSTKGRYGLRAMVELAAGSLEEHVSINLIAERQNISVNYLEQVFSILRNGGLVKSIKGAYGGYVLSDKSKNIKVGAILRILEGSLSVIDEKEIANSSDDPVDYFLNTYLWEKMNKCIIEIVDSVTLEDLVNEYKRLNDNRSDMYYI